MGSSEATGLRLADGRVSQVGTARAGGAAGAARRPRARARGAGKGRGLRGRDDGSGDVAFAERALAAEQALGERGADQGRGRVPCRGGGERGRRGTVQARVDVGGTALVAGGAVGGAAERAVAPVRVELPVALDAAAADE